MSLLQTADVKLSPTSTHVVELRGERLPSAGCDDKHPVSCDVSDGDLIRRDVVRLVLLLMVTVYRQPRSLESSGGFLSLRFHFDTDTHLSTRSGSVPLWSAARPALMRCTSG